MLIRITTSWACFGLIHDGLFVIRAAPICKWSVGRPVEDVIAYLVRRGAVVESVEET